MRHRLLTNNDANFLLGAQLLESLFQMRTRFGSSDFLLGRPETQVPFAWAGFLYLAPFIPKASAFLDVRHNYCLQSLVPIHTACRKTSFTSIAISRSEHICSGSNPNLITCLILAFGNPIKIEKEQVEISKRNTLYFLNLIQSWWWNFTIWNEKSSVKFCISFCISFVVLMHQKFSISYFQFSDLQRRTNQLERVEV